MGDIKPKSVQNVRTILPPIPSDNKPIGDLSIYNVGQLIELRDRQLHLLSNKKRLQCLSDKGTRIQVLHQRVLAELATRDAVSNASQLFSELNLASTGKSLTTQMEWHGHTNNGALLLAPVDDDTTADSAADERNPLKLLAQSRHARKLVTVEPAEPSLITAADRQAIAEFASEKPAAADDAASTEMEPHALYMCSINERHPVKKDRFLPHKTTVPSTVRTAADPAAPKPKSVGHRWENTAATPPQLRNGELVALSLQDSIDIQRQQHAVLRKIDLEHATERLNARGKLAARLMEETYKGSDNPGPLFGSYREAARPESSDEDGDSDDYAGAPYGGEHVADDDE